MHNREWLIRGTAWFAFLLYIGAELIRGRRVNPLAAPSLLTLGCAAMLLHIFCAFSYRFHWSHHAAYQDTARQTAEVTGLNWGGGIYINYLFEAVWLLEVIRFWRQSRRAIQTPRGWIFFTRAFFLFMFFNAAVVFVSGPARWLGLIGCVTLIARWAWRNSYVRSVCATKPE